MDWTQVLVILLALGGCFGFLLSKIEDVRKDLMKEIQKNREDILWLKFRLDPNEHHDWRKDLKEKTKEK